MGKLMLSRKEPPIGSVLSCSVAGVSYDWCSETQLILDDCVSLTTSQSISRHVARLNPALHLYPTHILHRTQVDHWLSVSSSVSAGGLVRPLLPQLSAALAPAHRLVPPNTTVADYEVFAALYRSSDWAGIAAGDEAPQHVLRWYNSILKQVSSVLSSLPEDVRAAACPFATAASPERESQASAATSSDAAAARNGRSAGKGGGKSGGGRREEGGKFVELPDAKEGEVVVRFPPEASGYLHIGHAKAALLNQHYQLAFKGKLIMRFDDTNPAKEDAHFEKVILDDLKLLEIKPDRFTHTSDYFDLMLQLCENLIRKGSAFVDDTDAETMKIERDLRKDSKNRSNSVEKNLSMWEEMKKGTEFGQTCAVRAKIDMTSNNGCMRDPTIYRCKPETHVRTGNKYKVYPTYDFACPIVDSIEGVTHALRTTEYHDRDEQFFWFLEQLELRKLHIYEYSRLNMNNTVLSKRKLTWFVEQGLVDGWDDPRFPTVRGIIRRGMTIEGLKEFIIAQGSSRSVVNMEWDKIWSFNKKVIDAIAPRYVALESSSLIPVRVAGTVEQATTAQKHPKDPSIGTKTVWVGPKILIEAADADVLKEGENATFINWGNLVIKKVNRENGVIVSVDAETNLSNTDYKKTLKVTWLVATVKSPLTPVVCVYFDHLINKGVLGKDEDFKNFIGHNTRSEVAMLGDDELKTLKTSDIIQVQRKGFFRVDEPYKEASLSSCKESPVVLFSVPDGHSKEAAVLPTAAKNAKAATPMSAKELSQSAKGKKAEKSPQEEVKAIVSSGAPKKAEDVNAEIKQQGDKIRQLKADKADKNVVMSEVAVLKELKESFKANTGVEWKPDIDMGQFASAAPATTSAGGASVIHSKIVDQGNAVRDLKASKADKAQVTAAVGILLSLKKDFKEATGTEWTPSIDISRFGGGAPAAPAAAVPAASPAVAAVPAPDSGSQASAGGVYGIHQKIVDQGNSIRSLKSSKADKGAVNSAVAVLLDLKKQFKEASGADWVPNINMDQFASSKDVAPPAAPSLGGTSASNGPLDLHQKIVDQGNSVRNLKSSKADKAEVTAAVNVLLQLKKEFKEAANIDWTPNIDVIKFSSAPATSAPVSFSPASSNTAPSDVGPLALHQKIVDQGNSVRQLKSSKADKSQVSSAVDILLQLKKQFKEATNIDWKPDIDVSKLGGSAAAAPIASSNSGQFDELNAKVKAQGDKVRQLKSGGADKTQIKSEVDILLKYKQEFKEALGVDWKPDMAAPPQHQSAASTPQPKPIAAIKPKETKKPAKKEEVKADDGKKQTRLGVEVMKEENLSEWYSQVITKSEMIEYYNVSGCYILRPWSYCIWDSIKNFLDGEIKKLGVENSYFPIFVSRDALEKEKTHIADFSPEVAWVTRSGSSELAEPIAIRPTSETVMYPAFAKWIQSHRDLPMRLNQWNNVVRWEFKQPTPFLRTREFLWQEGHTAFATQAEATEEVYQILDIYARVYEELLAIPVVKGKKTEKEKFAGGDFTTTTEAFISASGRGIQGATSHHLGQNFSKMFDIIYEDPTTQEKQFVYQNSWGLTTRTIGVMVMVHGDNKGLVLPPKVAGLQAVIMPVGITAKTSDDQKNALYDECKKLELELKAGGIRTKSDMRDNVTPAWKFNHWELKGVPLRLELGPREVASGQVFVVRRDNNEKQGLARTNIVQSIDQLLDTVQVSMLEKARDDLENHKHLVSSWTQFCNTLDEGKLILAPFCSREECEDTIKKESARDQDAEPGAPSMGAKSLCIPFQQPQPMPAGTRCIHPACGQLGQYYCLFGRSY